MHWKIIFAVILVLAIFGFFLTTEFGQPVFDSLKGSITGLFVKPIPKSGLFSMSLTANSESFNGLTIKLSNSSFGGTGQYVFIKFGDQTFSLKSTQTVSILIKNLRGTFSISDVGSIRITGDSNYIEVEETILSSTNKKKIDLEIVPSNFLLSDISSSKISLPSVTGTVQRFSGVKNDEVSFQGSNVEISNFVGYMKLEQGTIELNGLASSVKGDKFSFA